MTFGAQTRDVAKRRRGAVVGGGGRACTGRGGPVGYERPSRCCQPYAQRAHPQARELEWGTVVRCAVMTEGVPAQVCGRVGRDAFQLGVCE